MKKKILGGVIVIAIVAVAAFNVNINVNNKNISKLSLENIAALAQNESGTKVKYCNMYSSSADPEWFTECNSSTNSTTIYDCPSLQRYGGKGSQDRCTDK